MGNQSNPESSQTHSTLEDSEGEQPTEASEAEEDLTQTGAEDKDLEEDMETIQDLKEEEDTQHPDIPPQARRAEEDNHHSLNKTTRIPP